MITFWCVQASNVSNVQMSSIRFNARLAEQLVKITDGSVQALAWMKRRYYSIAYDDIEI